MSTRSWALPDPVHQWILQTTVEEPESLARVRKQTAAMPQSNMQISPEQGAFMAWLVHTLGVARALEIGTFTGYSALVTALAMPPEGRLLCCDVSREWTDIARAHWLRAGVEHKIELQLGPALDTLDQRLAQGEEGTYDLAFIDADKENYTAYYERCLKLVRPGGVIALDNALWSGKVADPSATDPDTRAIRAVAQHVAADPRVRSSLVPIGDGLLLATRR
ncbi:MAG: SAM-dependent methyltransferase [Deltaproteobacteria bacterium]|nr:MAG: SAM-dependent methyltransferase [Deltaproteobacteria bacterium]